MTSRRFRGVVISIPFALVVLPLLGLGAGMQILGVWIFERVELVGDYMIRWASRPPRGKLHWTDLDLPLHKDC
jgi:hypothetical protein